MYALFRSASALALLGLVASWAPAHFNMLLPQSASVKRGELVTFVYQWGHPFEHQLFNAPAPQQVLVVAPDGTRTELGKTLEKITVPLPEQKTATAYRFRFTPQERGDYVFVLTTPPIWMEEDQEFLQDVVQVVLHVQAQKGWDAVANSTFRVVPLTRPYGLQPGMVFQAQWGLQEKPLAGALVEIERYNPTAPKVLPPDEQITRTAKTDANGVVTSTLTEAGWWCLTASDAQGSLERNGKAYPLRRRATLWVFVDEKVVPQAK
jgi:cobalt/nickel transport protein